jgi:hypothetical protein
MTPADLSVATLDTLLSAVRYGPELESRAAEAELRKRLSARTVHPLALAYLEADAATSTTLEHDIAVDATWRAWRDAGKPVYADAPAAAEREHQRLWRIESGWCAYADGPELSECGIKTPCVTCSLRRALARRDALITENVQLIERYEEERNRILLAESEALARVAALEAEARTLRADTLDMAGNVIQAAGRGQAQFGIPGKVMTEPEAAQWAAEMLWTMAQAERVTNTTSVGAAGKEPT